ncbi:hypothetical protein I3842_08G106200 [Carya illinoinensis]|uniref:Uncharacterized protein n=1 Tax=Carya illinoinensis TaxID=32201 RepID=A0A922JBV3_CARIL|nr:hypothetical protein I3842_08G106200 [Carya illinoinensis]
MCLRLFGHLPTLYGHHFRIYLSTGDCGLRVLMVLCLLLQDRIQSGARVWSRVTGDVTAGGHTASIRSRSCCPCAS